MEDYLKYRFALEMLRQAGFTAKQIDELDGCEGRMLNGRQWITF